MKSIGKPFNYNEWLQNKGDDDNADVATLDS